MDGIPAIHSTVQYMHTNDDGSLETRRGTVKGYKNSGATIYVESESGDVLKLPDTKVFP